MVIKNKPLNTLSKYLSEYWNERKFEGQENFNWLNVIYKISDKLLKQDWKAFHHQSHTVAVNVTEIN